MHKLRQQGAVPPFRPIVSSIGTYNYNLAKYLCNLLTPLIPAEFCAEDSFSFVNEIQKLSMHNKFMVSFDVESLFWNIPLEESIDLAVSYITQYTNTTFSAKELKDLFHIATAAQSHFSFNGSFYNQVDGVAMGSPLAPVLANLFIRGCGYKISVLRRFCSTGCMSTTPFVYFTLKPMLCSFFIILTACI